ncbi:translation initiation factor [Flavobacteriales bacterium]|nr:translation initiation factor [Flavobacteriales bacterium]MDA7794163.1 translation initiation factor [Flavobacteriales bacterium]
MAKKKNKIGVMYSTNSNFEYEYESEQETIAVADQRLEVWIDKKNRGGKIATIVKGFVGTESDLKDLGKVLKSACGVGGSAKNGEIIIQGNVRDKVMQILSDKGYFCKRVGG